MNLSDVLEKVRDELEECDQRRIRDKKPALFELQEFALELKVVVIESETAQGGFDVKVLSLGGSGSQQTETVQIIRLTYRVAESRSGTKPVGSRLHGSSDQSPSHGIDLLE